MSGDLHLPAPAKVNLYLHVTGVKRDGMHELDTAFAFVDIGDMLHVRLAPTLTVTCSEAHLAGENNLVHRVLAAMQRTFHVKAGLKVHVDKQLPEQAGLGGGSSDAATAILAANHLWRLGLSVKEIIAFAAAFGADIPCFLFGFASRARGIGEQLSRWDDSLPEGHCVLAYPGIGLATAAVFRRFDATDAQLTASGAGDTIRGHRSSGYTKVRIGSNMLEEAACTMTPKLAELLAAMRRQARMAWMSGSGSACVALVDESEQAQQLAGDLRSKGLARWTHAGHLLAVHPLARTCVRLPDWGVAKW